jgi:hypothetical protein
VVAVPETLQVDALNVKPVCALRSGEIAQEAIAPPALAGASVVIAVPTVAEMPLE